MQSDPTPPRRRALGLRHLPLLVILVAACLGALLLKDHLSLDTLAARQAQLLAFRDQHHLLAMALFLAAYVLIVAFSLPGGTVATLTGGFLFGLFPGVFLNVGGASLGAIAVFLAARAGFGRDVATRIAQRGGPAARLQAGLQRNVWSALLVMRLVPAVPFFLANLLPAFAGVRIWPFAVTTVLGIIPAGVVYTSVGAGLGDVLARGETPDLSIIASPQVLLPLLGLAGLSALPMLIGALRRKD